MLPYAGSDRHMIFQDITGGVRPSRPIDPSQNQWLQDSVWDVITASWRPVPKKRCKLPVVYDIYLTPSHQEVQNVKTSEPSVQNGEALDAVTGRQQRGSLLPRITSFFQFLRSSGSEIQRRVNAMDRVGPLTRSFLLSQG